LHRGHLLQRACACVLCRKRVFGDDFTCVYVLARSHRVRIRVLNLHFWRVYRACATGKRLNRIVAVVWSPRKPLTLLCTSMNNKLLLSVLACTRPILCIQLWSICSWAIYVSGVSCSRDSRNNASFCFANNTLGSEGPKV
jgi:hypothetical protein